MITRVRMINKLRALLAGSKAKSDLSDGNFFEKNKID